MSCTRPFPSGQGLARETKVCGASYQRLFDLVSHVRAVHSGDGGLDLICQVEECGKIFKKQNTWYRHVLDVHYDVYYGVGCSTEGYEEGGSNSGLETTESDSVINYEEEEQDSTSSQGPVSSIIYSGSSFSHPAPSSISTSQEDVLASKLLTIREKHHLSHAAIDEVLEFTRSVCGQLSVNMISAIQQCAQDNKMDTTLPFFLELPALFENLSPPLTLVQSSYKRQCYIGKNLPYVEPIWHEVGTHVGMVGQTPTNVSDGFYYVPLLQSLQELLNNSSVRSQVMSGSRRTLGGFLFDICDGDLFEDECFEDSMLYIIAYYDEFTLTNPLMSRKKKYKIGGVYFTLGNLDPALRSKLEAINLVCLFNSDLLRNYSINVILDPFISDLKKLDTCYVKGKLIAFVGDTPAVNLVGGFKEGVSLAMRKCRQCMATFDQIQTKYRETEFQLRTKDQHATHCQYVDGLNVSESERSHYSKVYGINRSSILMDISYFDVTKQLPQDLMHVLLEGVFPLHMQQLLNYVIHECNALSLSQINSRMMAYPYAYFEDKPSPLTELDMHGSQSAAQMWELFNILPFLIENELHPDDRHYECYMLLTTIASILFSHTIAKDQIPLLSLLIQEYLELFAALYPHKHLTPKMHYLVHLPSLILRYGPLVYLWAMRFEAKHKEMKNTARATSFRNILKTLSEHHQRLMAINLQYDTKFSSVTFTAGPATPLVSLVSLPYFNELQSSHSSLLKESLCRANWVEVAGTTYKAKQCYMMIGTSQIQSGVVPKFGFLFEIIICGETALFIFNVMESLGYHAGLGAYEIAPLAEYKCLFVSSIKCYHRFNAVHHGNLVTKFIKPKYDLTVYCNYE